MVKACKGFLTDDGLTRIWEQSYDSLMIKVNSCSKLYKSYQQAFQRAKKKIEETPHERPFDFSEMYIFGKFDAFCKRLDKVMQN